MVCWMSMGRTDGFMPTTLSHVKHKHVHGTQGGEGGGLLYTTSKIQQQQSSYYSEGVTEVVRGAPPHNLHVQRMSFSVEMKTQQKTRL